MHTTRYMTPTATALVQVRPADALAGFGIVGVQEWKPGIAREDVFDLLAAAGSLTVGEIAGGLDVAVAEVAPCVRSLVRAGDLREDEYGRYRVVG
jgi:hypothetical protein